MTTYAAAWNNWRPGRNRASEKGTTKAMPTLENLECVVTWRGNGLKSEPFFVAGDPTDAKKMQDLLAQLAQGWRDLDATRRWLDQYEMTVRRKDKPWEKEINVPGIKPND